LNTVWVSIIFYAPSALQNGHINLVSKHFSKQSEWYHLSLLWEAQSSKIKQLCVWFKVSFSKFSLHCWKLELLLNFQNIHYIQNLILCGCVVGVIEESKQWNPLRFFLVKFLINLVQYSKCDLNPQKVCEFKYQFSQ